MDWLSDEQLFCTFFMRNKYVKRFNESRGPNSLLFDYEDALSQMLISLQRSLQKIAYDKVTKTAKSNDESSKLRALGNKWFSSSASDAFDKALEFYTKSIAYALSNSEEMALGYANRSTVLFKMNCPQECLDNIERALPNYPEKLKSKLYDRQADCYSQLAVDCTMEAKAWLDKVPYKDSSRAALVETLKDCPKKKLQNFFMYNDCVVPEIENPSKSYPCASDAVQVQHSKQNGRHVVATRDIDVGEVLIVEKPYFQSLDRDKSYTHCSHCMAFLWCTVPCDECVNLVYCSEECIAKAWQEYHEMECTVSDLIMKYGDYGCVHRTEYVRLLMQMHHEAGGLRELKKRVRNILGNTLDACGMNVQDEWYQGATLESILCLNSHEDKLTAEDFGKATVRTLRVMFYLLTNTEFFGVKFDRNETYDVDVINFMSQNPDIIFIGRLLIKLFYILRRNSFRSVELTETGPKDLGIGTARLISLLNNSCHPNIFVMCAKDQLVTYAAHPIKRGEQIFTCYCGSYGVIDKAERQQHYMESYFFTCNCIACTENWPMKIDDKVTVGVKIERIWQRCRTSDKNLCTMINNVFTFGHYRDLDELMICLRKVIRAIYQEVGANSMEMRFILQSLHQGCMLSGNVRKHRNLSLAFK